MLKLKTVSPSLFLAFILMINIIGVAYSAEIKVFHGNNKIGFHFSQQGTHLNLIRETDNFSHYEIVSSNLFAKFLIKIDNLEEGQYFQPIAVEFPMWKKKSKREKDFVTYYVSPVEEKELVFEGKIHNKINKFTDSHMAGREDDFIKNLQFLMALLTCNKYYDSLPEDNPDTEKFTDTDILYVSKALDMIYNASSHFYIDTLNLPHAENYRNWLKGKLDSRANNGDSTKKANLALYDGIQREKLSRAISAMDAQAELAEKIKIFAMFLKYLSSENIDVMHIDFKNLFGEKGIRKNRIIFYRDIAAIIVSLIRSHNPYDPIDSQKNKNRKYLNNLVEDNFKSFEEFCSRVLLEMHELIRDESEKRDEEKEYQTFLRYVNEIDKMIDKMIEMRF